MIRYFTNRELSKKLEVNLARWKRWSRSFLPPDPLGGMQSGYARQYLFKDLFKVLLGGHLLSLLKLSVADSKQVVDDLSPWLKKNGFLDWHGSRSDRTIGTCEVNDCRIYFSPLRAKGSKRLTGFRYLVRRRIGAQSADNHQIVETYVETHIHSEPSTGHDLLHDPDLRVLNISALREWAIRKLRPPRP
jgi:hypothetical protein